METYVISTSPEACHRSLKILTIFRTPQEAEVQLDAHKAAGFPAEDAKIFRVDFVEVPALTAAQSGSQPS